MNSFNNKVVIITGAVRGIGLSLAEAFAKQGATIYAIDINEASGKTAEALFQEKNLRYYYRYTDLSKQESATKIINDIAIESGRIDLLINNARARNKSTWDSQTESDWDTGMNIMLRAPYFLSQATIAFMKKNNQSGSIINIASILSQFVIQESPVYHIAKAGLVHMTRYLAVQAAPFRIRVNSISPGFIVQDEHLNHFHSEKNTSFRELSLKSVPLAKPGTSQDIASTALFLASDAASFITGQDIVVDGGSVLREQLDLLLCENNPQSLNT